MARRAHVYPQVETGAEALVDAAVLTAPAHTPIADALRLVRQRDAHAVLVRDRFVLREDLVRAASLGVDGARAEVLARPLPVLDAGATEARVRRHLASGAPLVVVTRQARVAGAITPSATIRPCMSMTDRLARRLPVAAREVLEAATRVAAARRARVYLAGGVVRDALADRPLPSPDLDLVVEGDGPGVARGLAEALHAPLVAHDRFLTASVGPTAAGRIDVATARSEHYEGRGVLPRVLPASIEADLRRRDFTVNAMAVELESGTFGLLDPHGGRHDLAARRLRVLHPASFVEDPTRMFRAARYAVRLGLRADAWTVRAHAWALSLAPYPALSGARIVAELEHVVHEADPDAVLRRLAQGGVFRLIDARLGPSRATRAALTRFAAARAWARAHEDAVADVELLLVCLLGVRERPMAAAALARLGLAGERAARLVRALDQGDRRAARIAGAARPSEQARAVRGASALELAWLGSVPDDAQRATLDRVLRDLRADRPVLRGDDVIALGVPPGPAVAAALDALTDARLDGDARTRSEEEAFVRTWVRTVDGRGASRPGSSRKEW